MNSTTLTGNLTDHVDLRYTTNGQAVANFTVAVNRRYRNGDGSWEETTDGFFRVAAFGQLAEHAAASLVKGTRVLVTGRLSQDNYTDRDGNPRTSLQLVADDVAPSLIFATATVTKATRDKETMTVDG